MDLDDMRDKIDKIDSQILSLLNQRLEHVRHIGDIKKDQNTVYYVPARESKLLRKLIEKNEGLLTNKAIKAIFVEIMSASLALEKPISIACLGPESTYTHQAAVKKFGQSVSYDFENSIRGIFEKVFQGASDYGVVPVENSLEGAVTDTLDMFAHYDLTICSEIFLPIRHNFMLKDENASVEKIYSHPQVFGQCRNWLQENYPKAALIPVASTTIAAKMVDEKNVAVIASDLVAKLHGLEIAHRSIQDSHENTTRFFVIGDQGTSSTGKDKTSLFLSLQDEYGSLVDALKPFKEYGVNLTKIESRPSKKKLWKYHFYVDFEGHVDDKNVAKCLDFLKSKKIGFKYLGSYPQEI
ncbi:chorismate mutase [PVC group bacterium (ex Bugula neritina AB1)]|nr:chorismate mutase [PVC group bacterium (ex Bugula neritina AB1)]